MCLPQKLLRKFTGPLQLGAQEIQGPQAKQSGNKLRGIAQSFTKLLRASIDSLDFRRGPAFDDRYGGAKGQLEKQLLLNALWAVGQLLQQIYRNSKPVDRIGIGRSLRRLLARLPQILNRFLEVVAAAVMMRQLLQMIVQLRREHRLQRHCGAFVQ